MNIQVATTTRFRKAFRTFREKEQKQIDEGITTFLIEPTNPSSNFEPLNFIDHKLKSIRISDNIRVILAIMDGVYFLLHVDYHDKAYAWGENKRIDRNMVTGAIQFYTDAEEVKELQATKEPETGEKPVFGHCSSEQLEIIGVPEGWIPKLLTVVDEEEYTNLWSYLPEDAVENLEAVRNGFDIRNLVMQINAEQQKENLPIVEQVKKQEGFELLTDDESLAEALKKDISVFRYYLHPTQKFLLNYEFKGPVKLTGTAGTGKTVAALHKTKQLAERLPLGAKPVFFTTYTKYLIKNIQAMFEEARLPKNKLVVTNLHQFAVQYAKELELIQGNPKFISSETELLKLWKKYCATYFISSFAPEFLLAEYREIIQEKHITSEAAYFDVPRTGRGDILVKSKRIDVWKAFLNFESFQRSENTFTFEDIIFQLNKYLEHFPEYKPFSHVICDEVQDFNNLELRLLRNLVPPGKNDMFLSGDPFQNIYQKKINFSESGINIKGRSYRLKTNYRTTEEIQTFAFNTLKNQNFEDFNGSKIILQKCESLVYGEEPIQLLFKSEQAEHEYLANYIRENFGLIGLHEICFATRFKDKLVELMDFFKSKHYPCINLDDVSDLKETEGKIVFSTLHSLKGLEFKNLVVFNLSQVTFPYIPKGFKSWDDSQQKEYLKTEHALLYVAFSRAISRLIVTGTGDKIQFG